MRKSLVLELKTPDGRPMKEDAVVATGEPATVTVRQPIVIALLANIEGDRPTGEEKYRRYKLALGITEGTEYDFKPEDLVLIKRLVGMHYTAWVAGQVWDWADADAAELSAKKKSQAK